MAVNDQKFAAGKLQHITRTPLAARLTAGDDNTVEQFQGRIVEAAEAKDLGLVNRVVSDDSVEKEALATARRIAQGAPLVARWHKKFINRLLMLPNN